MIIKPILRLLGNDYASKSFGQQRSGQIIGGAVDSLSGTRRFPNDVHYMRTLNLKQPANS